MTLRGLSLLLMLLATAAGSSGQPTVPANPAGIDWQVLPGLEVARTETTVAQFRRFVNARQLQTQAERQGGDVYESGWVRRVGWHWRTPFGSGRAAHDAEPAAHITFDEAQTFCRWAGGRLPRDDEWLRAAYSEQRPVPSPPFERGRRYEYPGGNSPSGAQCLVDCGAEAAARGVRHGADLTRGAGHARVDQTRSGVNGLHDMGGNLWEWVDEPAGDADRPAGSADRRTRGGSWWYGAAQMRADYIQQKPADTAALYIGFRCVRRP